MPPLASVPQVGYPAPPAPPPVLANPSVEFTLPLGPGDIPPSEPPPAPEPEEPAEEPAEEEPEDEA